MPISLYAAMEICNFFQAEISQSSACFFAALWVLEIGANLTRNGLLSRDCCKWQQVVIILNDSICYSVLLLETCVLTATCLLLWWNVLFIGKYWLCSNCKVPDLTAWIWDLVDGTWVYRYAIASDLQEVCQIWWCFGRCPTIDMDIIIYYIFIYASKSTSTGNLYFISAE